MSDRDNISRGKYKGKTFAQVLQAQNKYQPPPTESIYEREEWELAKGKRENYPAKRFELLIPPEMAKDIVSSFYLKPGSKYGAKNNKGLFLTPENYQFLGERVYNNITNLGYVQNLIRLDQNFNLPHLNSDMKVKIMIEKFKGNKSHIVKSVYLMVKTNRMPYKEELTTQNPIEQLHFMNLQFIDTNSKNIVSEPSGFIKNFYSINPETGKDESNLRFELDPASYSDGTWHPEFLFTNTQLNKADPVYWTEENVQLDSTQGATGLNHKYNTTTYGKTGYGMRNSTLAIKLMPETKELQNLRKQGMDNLSNDDYYFLANQPNNSWRNIDDLKATLYNGDSGKTENFSNQGSNYGPNNGMSYDQPRIDPRTGKPQRYDMFEANGLELADNIQPRKNNGGQFPIWQYSMDYRPYDRSNEGLREDGSRYRNPIRSYNNYSLIKTPHYK